MSKFDCPLDLAKRCQSVVHNSVIAATVKTVILAGVDGDNGGDKFGIYADAGIRSVVVKDPKRTFTNPTALTGFEDFEIEVV
jgi:hypothetical protein